MGLSNVYSEWHSVAPNQIQQSDYMYWRKIEIFAGNKINRNFFIEFKVFKIFCFDFCFEFWFEFLFRLLFSYLFSWQTNQISLKHDHNFFLHGLPSVVSKCLFGKKLHHTHYIWMPSFLCERIQYAFSNFFFLQS